MDIVITYVNSLDPVWQEQYRKIVNAPLSAERFRDWDTLRYLFRGIAKNLSFVENVFLVVSTESQVPSWINRETVNVVLHKDIIPEEYLPTFNSTTIEMFLHKIPGLGEEYVYFNDDCFPLMRCKETDFFIDGKINGAFYPVKRNSDTFGHQVVNSYLLACHLSGKDAGNTLIRPEHICSPMLKSACEEVFEKGKSTILNSLSPIRENQNFNQYLFSNYIFFTGRGTNIRIPYEYFSFYKNGIWHIAKYIDHPTKPFVCINDGKMNKATFNNYKCKLLRTFDRRFPSKSKYEK